MRDFAFIKRHQNFDYYDGVRDALKNFAIHKDGEERVGMGMYTLKECIDKVNEYEAESLEEEHAAWRKQEQEMNEEGAPGYSPTERAIDQLREPIVDTAQISEVYRRSTPDSSVVDQT